MPGEMEERKWEEVEEIEEGGDKRPFEEAAHCGRGEGVKKR